MPDLHHPQLTPEAAAVLDHEWHLLIGGKLVPASESRTFENRSPFTRSVIADIPDATDADVDAAVAAASEARREWRATPAPERARFVERFADLVEEHREELA